MYKSRVYSLISQFWFNHCEQFNRPVVLIKRAVHILKFLTCALILGTLIFLPSKYSSFISGRGGGGEGGGGWGWFLPQSPSDPSPIPSVPIYTSSMKEEVPRCPHFINTD